MDKLMFCIINRDKNTRRDAVDLITVPEIREITVAWSTVVQLRKD